MESTAKKRKLPPSLSAAASSSTTPPHATTLTPAPTSFAFGFYDGAAAASKSQAHDESMAAPSTTISANAAAASSPTPHQKPPHPSRAHHARPRRITTRYAWLHCHVPNNGMAAVPPRERVRVLWETSSSASNIKIRRLSGEVLRVTAAELSPLEEEEEEEEEEGDQESMQHLDLLFDDSRAATTTIGRVGLPLPPQVGPDLASLIYPLTPEYFLKEIWNKKALVIQGGATRLRSFCRDLREGTAAATTTTAAAAAAGATAAKRSSSSCSCSSFSSFSPLTLDVPSLL